MKFERSVDDGESTTIIASACDREGHTVQMRCVRAQRRQPIELYRSSRLQPCALQRGERSCRSQWRPCEPGKGIMMCGRFHVGGIVGVVLALARAVDRRSS